MIDKYDDNGIIENNPLSNKTIQDPDVLEKKVTASMHRLADDIREYVRAQKEEWQQLPELAQQYLDAFPKHGGYLREELEKTISGFFPIKVFPHYGVYVLVNTGEIVAKNTHNEELVAVHDIHLIEFYLGSPRYKFTAQVEINRLNDWLRRKDDT